MKKKIIDIESHSFLRMLERGAEFNLDYYECRDRTFQTVRLGKQAKRKHKSRHNVTYYNYFRDNISFYVICLERDCGNFIKVLIKTVIIERGRE